MNELSIDLEIELDCLPVSANFQYQYHRNRIHLSSRVRELKKKLAKELQGKDKISGKIKLFIIFCMADKRKRDLDNMLKPLIDSIKNVVIDDDSMIYEIHCRKLEDCKKAKTIIRIQKYN